VPGPRVEPLRRGDIYLARLPEPVGRRPVVIVTRSNAIAVRTAVTVAPVTRTIRDIPTEVPLGRRHGLKSRSVANCDSLQTIPQRSLRRGPIGRLTADELSLLDRALRFALGIRT
jgi:mRNA interferase MazF